MKRYEYIDGVKVSKYPLLNLYIERMGESWQAKLFGITMPLFLIINISLLIIFPTDEFSWMAFSIQGIVSLWFIISYTLLVNLHTKSRKQELKDAILRDSKKVINIFIFNVTFIIFFRIFT
jgi:hypothetical protein